jgi:branched-chain amino acid transport system permease protein
LFKRGVVDPLFKYGMMPIVVATIGSVHCACAMACAPGYSVGAATLPQICSPMWCYNIGGVTVSATDIGTFAFCH